MEGVVGGCETAEVSDVFAEGLTSVDVDAGVGLVGVELCGESAGDLLEVGVVGVGPPFADLSFGVELCAFGVEGVGDLVADDGADGAVVGGVGRGGVEEGWLENGGGEVEAVVERKIDGVDGLRLHAPLMAVNGLVDARESVLVVEEVGALEVAEKKIGWRDDERAVAAPVIRVAHANVEGFELSDGFGFGVGVHPVDGFETLVEGG